MDGKAPPKTSTLFPWPKPEPKLWLSRRAAKWEVAGRPPAALKGPHRSGLFKDAFKNRAVLVYGTHGSGEENAWAEAKARYDAEIFWYQGNGSLEVISDTDFVPAQTCAERIRAQAAEMPHAVRCRVRRHARSVLGRSRRRHDRHTCALSARRIHQQPVTLFASRLKFRAACEH